VNATLTTIDAVCESAAQIDPKHLGQDCFAYIDISSIDRDAKAIEVPSVVPIDEAPSRARKLVAENDTLVSTVRPNLNAVAFVEKRFDGMVASTGFTVLRPRVDKVVPKFLYYLVRSAGFVNEMGARATGASYPAVSDRIVKSYEFRLPILGTQSLIVELLDQADALRRKRREANVLHERILASLFQRLFGDISSTGSPWQTLPLPECGTFVSGATPSKDEERFWGGDIDWVTPKDMKVPNIHASKIQTTAAALAETNLKLVQPGHVLLVVRGMILARHVPVAINRVPVAINQDMKAIRPIDDLSPEFLRSCLQLLEPVILARMGTAAHGTKKLGQEEMKDIRIPLAPRNLQDHFSKLVRSYEAMTPSREATTQNLETLFQSLLARAFDGRLFSAAAVRETQAEMGELLQELEHQAKS